MAFADLQSFIAHLERHGELKRVKVEVDPKFVPWLELERTRGA